MLPATSLIPIRDDNPTRTTSWLTMAIIAANVYVFVFHQLPLGQGCRMLSFLYEWALVPREITSGRELTGSVPSSLSSCPGLVLGDKSIYASLISSMFLHGGLLHLGGNMLFLWVFGNNIEDTLGKGRYLLFYLGTGIVAGLAHVMVNPASVIPTVGASGAVSGLLGAYIILFPKAQVTTVIPIFIFLQFIRIPAGIFLGIWFVYQFFIGTAQQAGGAGVAWMAHVGGFVAGMILIFAFGGPGRRRQRGPSLLD